MLLVLPDVAGGGKLNGDDFGGSDIVGIFGRKCRDRKWKKICEILRLFVPLWGGLYGDAKIPG